MATEENAYGDYPNDCVEFWERYEENTRDLSEQDLDFWEGWESNDDIDNQEFGRRDEL